MILTCPNCHNSFIMDENLYAQQGGAICDQCHQPLVPAAGSGMYGQPQWGPSAGQQWSQNNAQPQWNQQPNNQWNNPAQPQNQWAQPPQLPASQWAQQQMPQDNGMEIQWGQQPVNAGQWGEQAQWSAMADQPAETQALLDPVAPPSNAERTMALDLDNDLGGFPSMPQPKIPGAGPYANTPTVNDMQSAKQDSSGKLVVGSSAGIDNNGNTQEIKLQALEELYGDKVNPIKRIFTSVPLRYHIILGSVLVLAIVGAIIAIVVISKPPKVETEITKKGEIVPVGTEKPKTFDDIVEDTLTLSLSFLPYPGEPISEGSLVAVASDIGVYYEGKKIGDISEVTSGGAFSQSLFDQVSDDVDDLNQPIVILFDETLQMSAVYRTIYSLAPTSRRILFGATARGAVTSLSIQPCKWPDYELFTYNDCANAVIDVKITKKDITMTRTAGDSPLSLDDNGEPVMELRDELISNKLNLQNIRPAIPKLRAPDSGVVRFVADGDVTFGVFFKTVTELYGSQDNPNIREMYLAPISLD